MVVYIYTDRGADYNHMYSTTTNALQEWLAENFPGWHFVGVHKSGYATPFQNFLALQVSYSGDR
jgi:hypothetical protein